ncbi:MAG: HD domain-containing protein, partial [Spirochaetaceae bacterium]|nr:HD domain-containing protein [Spirochaetaceae bacterium]
KYTPEEYEEMKRHSREGAIKIRKILGNVEDPYFVKVAVNIAYYHHEKWKGQGYPKGITGLNIPIEARIMALVDVFDALVSKRCYKDSFSYDEAFTIIKDSLGQHFDPDLGKLFLECRPELEIYYNNAFHNVKAI